ncbi:unnamed protein product [Penicillium olsonii]|uniref:Uncharacterized protein n=1 Tax=Penicillium olsonii TaxID=99116 RepID=A0A9W4MTI7_PENOL|nr:unnamed protein product [Penicillium olsonii]CAG8092019.1 unnamed protein product [Penicillium olsonii]
MSQQKVCGSICEPRTTQDIPVSELHLRALHWINNPTLTPNPSFCAAQYNLLIATFANAQLMGLTLDLLQEDLASQFNLVGPSSLHLPPTLWPSKLQRKVLHHPWIDLLPMSSMREGILSRLDTIDEDEACGDIFGICSSSGDSGLLVWGEAWDPLAYEASPDLIRKWFWIAKECPDVIRSTNYWRRRRGEKALVIEEE